MSLYEKCKDFFREIWQLIGQSLSEGISAFRSMRRNWEDDKELQNFASTTYRVAWPVFRLGLKMLIGIILAGVIIVGVTLYALVNRRNN